MVLAIVSFCSTHKQSPNDSMLCDFKAQHDYKASSGAFRWVCTAILVGWKRDFKVRRMSSNLGYKRGLRLRVMGVAILRKKD